MTVRRISKWSCVAAALLLASCSGGSKPSAPAAGTNSPGGAARTVVTGSATATTIHDGFTANGIACAACHPCGAAGNHSLAWMDQASSGFHAAAANGGLASCQGCHGANLDGVGGSTTIACAQCHGASWKTNCTMCHGGTDNTTGAPPRSTWGNDADATRVGAHTSHLGAKHGLAAPVACGACHVVPADALAAGHIDGATATVTFSSLAAQGGAPTWTRATATCASVYCHGATLAGGSNTAPAWTVTDGSQVGCGSCHAVPPPTPHVARTDCATCHSGYTATTVNAATHIDGKVDVVALTCSACHGDATRVGLTGADANVQAAPPVDSKGNAAVTARGVGVHVQHVNQATYRSAPIACSECHFNAVPTTTNHADGTVQFAFGALAKNASWGGVTPAPVWNGTTCAGTYCHGAFKNGANATMTWTQAGALGCTSCHGAPPGGNHPQNTNCGNCHGGYSSSSVNAAHHMNGVLEIDAMTCTSCHGKAGQPATASSPLNAAPPLDTSGLATGGIRIGAHASHLVGKTFSSGIACQDCHPSVGTYTLTHPNGIIDVGFTNGTSASFNVGTYTLGSGTTAATCSSTWCHAVKNRSGYSSGGTLPTPSWNGSITACTACHGLPPSTGQHQRDEHVSRGCGVCHPGYATSATYNSSTVNKSVHVNGTRDVGGTGTSIRSWYPATRTCQPTCHDTETW